MFTNPYLLVFVLLMLALFIAIPAASPERIEKMPAYVPLSHSYSRPKPLPLQPALVEASVETPEAIVEGPSTTAAAAAAADGSPPPLGAEAARLRAAAAAAAAATAYPQRSTPAEAPWLFPGSSRASKRAGEQMQMRKNSGYMHRDSALPPGMGGGTVLTGTAWHHGGDAAAAKCSERGTWAAPLRRCDCGPFAWGADCSISVVTQTICVYNDSRAWFCDKPACAARGDEVASAAGEQMRCVGEPLGGCPRGCSGRGRCSRGVCACFDGFHGDACGRPVQAWASPATAPHPRPRLEAAASIQTRAPASGRPVDEAVAVP
jgi:hypothetical protein